MGRLIAAGDEILLFDALSRTNKTPFSLIVLWWPEKPQTPINNQNY